VRILVVEDEPKLARVIVTGLKAEQFAVDHAEDGEMGLELASEAGYDAMILDLGLPKLDGMTLLKRLRKQHREVPVIILSSRSSVEDRVNGLQAGADDYVLKPFAFEELLARVYAVLRRPPKLMDTMRVADLELDRLTRTTKRAGKVLNLTQREFAVLEYLMRNVGRPVTRTMLIEHVWNIGYEGLTNIVDVYINYLRAKVDHGFEKKLIHTARGVGYVLMDPDERNDDKVD
jgi:two-component system copper resistance phosphate regulon response regulator CusR